MVQNMESMEDVVKHPNQTLGVSFAPLEKRVASRYRGGTQQHICSSLQDVLR